MTNQFISKEFLSYVNNNYDRIQSDFERQLGEKYSQDNLQDAIINVYDKIERSGFKFDERIYSGRSFENYLFLAARNCSLIAVIADNKQRETHCSYESEEQENEWNEDKEVDKAFIEEDEEEKNERLELMFLEDYLSEQIFRYVERNFSAMQSGFFKFYYMNRITLQKISDVTGWSKPQIYNQVSFVRQQVLTKFEGVQFNHRKRKEKRN